MQSGLYYYADFTALPRRSTAVTPSLVALAYFNFNFGDLFLRCIYCRGLLLQGLIPFN